MLSKDDLSGSKSILDLLQAYKLGKIDENSILKLLKLDYIEKIDNFAQLDIFRQERKGIPEVIFAQSKSVEMIIEIIDKMLAKKDFILISRIREDQFPKIEEYVKSNPNYTMDSNKRARTAKIYKRGSEKNQTINSNIGSEKEKGKVGIISAGTSDIPVAEESKMVIEAMGCETLTCYDIGIAGFHRIFEPLKQMLEADVDVFIVVAGMEGTLPGVITALVNVPVIGVPTSSGYGYKGNGEGALITMLQSCSPGLMVVNIDNGFGAGACAALIAKNAHRTRNS